MSKAYPDAKLPELKTKGMLSPLHTIKIAGTDATLRGIAALPHGYTIVGTADAGASEICDAMQETAGQA